MLVYQGEKTDNYGDPATFSAKQIKNGSKPRLFGSFPIGIFTKPVLLTIYS